MKCLMCTVLPATAKKPKRVKVQGEEVQLEREWDNNLSDTANMRFAANEALFEVNSSFNNATSRTKWVVQAGGLAPDQKTYVFVISC